MNFLQDPVVISNISNIILAGIVSASISFLITPLIGRLARLIGAGDLPKSKVSKLDRSFASRINTDYKPRLGGLAMFVGLISVIILFGIGKEIAEVNIGFLWGMFVIALLGILDDKYKLSGGTQLFVQFIAALLVVINMNMNSFGSITFLGSEISLNWFQIDLSGLLGMGTVIMPAHLFYAMWIMIIINFVNWASGIDGLNISISSITAFTMLLFVLAGDSFILPLAIFIAAFIGGNLGYFPYNYNPSKIIPGSVGEYLNGYLLAVFAIYGSAKWSVTVVLFGLVIIDALIVIIGRFKRFPEVRKNPLNVLKISDTTHLHHRLMSLGYSRKAVLLIESMMAVILGAIAVVFGIENEERSSQVLIAFAVAFAFLVITFTMIYLVQNNGNRKKNLGEILANRQKQKEITVRVTTEEEQEEKNEEYERFIY